MSYLELCGINKSFGNFKASNDANLRVEKGRLVGLLGPSGSGKTTILRMIAGLETPDSGDIMINGARVNDMDARLRGIGFVFQNYALFRYMSVFENVAFGLRVKKETESAIKKRVGELMSLVGLEGFEDRFPSQLSGGQRQRVAFARAIAPNPQILLLDEPFAAIDAKVRKDLRKWLRDTISALGVTSVFVTHDQDEAVEVADEIVVINAGHVEQKGSPVDIYKHPATPFVARFIGHSDAVKDAASFKGFGTARDFAEAIVRPEFIRVEKHGLLEDCVASAEDGVVEDISFRGDNMEIKVSIGGAVLTARYSLEKPELSVGEKVSVLIRRIYVFAGDRTEILENENLRENTVFI